MKRLLYVLLTLAWATPVAAQTSTFAIPADSLMAPVTVFPASAMNGAGVVNCAACPFNISAAGTAVFGVGGTGMTLTANNLQLAAGGSYLGSNVDASAAFKVNSNLLISATAPTITSAGTSPTVPNANGTAAFRVNVGTGGTATTIVLALPTATAGWNCMAENLTGNAANRADARMALQSSTTTAATIQYQTVSTGAAKAFTALDIVAINCVAF